MLTQREGGHKHSLSGEKFDGKNRQILMIKNQFIFPQPNSLEPIKRFRLMRFNSCESAGVCRWFLSIEEVYDYSWAPMMIRKNMKCTKK